MIKTLKNIHDKIFSGIWEADVEDLKYPQKVKIIALRSLKVLINDFNKNNLPLQASALTNITVLSMLPTLAFVFAFSKAMGLADMIKDQQEFFFGELPEQIRDILLQVFTLIDQANLKAVGLVGIAISMFTAISMMSKIEHSFNMIWGIKKNRDLMTKVKEYLFIFVTLPPILIATASANAFLSSNKVQEYLTTNLFLGEGIFEFYSLLVKIISPLIIAFGFTFLYRFLPNTKVNFRPAFIASFLVTIGWSLTQYIYVNLQIGVSSYPLYGTFAVIPFFLVWLFIAWLIILLGAQLCFALQNHATYEEEDESSLLKGEDLFNAAIVISISISRKFLTGDAWEAHIRLQELRVPVLLGHKILTQLTDAGIITPVGPRNEIYKASRDLHNITLLDIHNAVMGSGEKNFSLNSDSELGIKEKNINFETYQSKLSETNIYSLLKPNND
ncbi:membrane protein-like protein [Lentisphaera araneosa HTCC2155]|uniref:Membrane protein-like protein n=1 Tax=Lentisphaera araneosa HTCC2155 TaxID=313628 RepID=A6DS27_9BACT|nr:YhjD/YihY/BrkB family envelope integrity protein [Lentisphaera araneosa]EDM25602.1 membrane protein-like protein [Lentisphaera araneosa HTCC2155]